MKLVRKFLRGMSFRLDTLFFRNLTLILATIFIWRGVWNLSDKFFFPGNFLMSNFFTILVGLILLFVFDSEIEESK